MTFALYALAFNKLEEAREFIEEVLDMKLSAHESSYIGEYYRFGRTGSEDFVLRLNLDPIDGEPAEEEFSSSKVLLYMNNASRHKVLMAKLEAFPNVVHLLKEEAL